MNNDNSKIMALLSEFEDLKAAREHAVWAYSVTEENLLDDGKQPKDKSKSKPHRSRNIRKNRLTALKKALDNRDDRDDRDIDLYSDINQEFHDLGAAVPDFYNLGKSIDNLLYKLKGKAGRSDVDKFHAAAPYLLQYFTQNRGKVSASKYEKGGKVKYSEAIEFLNKEFQLLAGKEFDFRSTAKTAIEKWLKSQITSNPPQSG